MQLRLKDMIYVGLKPYSNYGVYSVYVVEYRSDYDIIKLLEDLLNSNASTFEVNKKSNQVRAFVPGAFKLNRVL